MSKDIKENLTWNELINIVEEENLCSSMDNYKEYFYIDCKDSLDYCSIIFIKNGVIEILCNNCYDDEFCSIIAKHRTPYQMLQIIKNIFINDNKE